MGDGKKGSHKGMWQHLRESLEGLGIDIERLGEELEATGLGFKVVCVAPDLKDSVDEVSRTPRDQSVMVRIDEETSKTLDAWVETGAVKSRSEAAAVFIREGLKVRAGELEQLEDALREVEGAKERLRKRVREVFGEGDAAQQT